MAHTERVNKNTEKESFKLRFNRFMHKIGIDTDFDTDFASIDLMRSPPHRLSEVLLFSDLHISQRDHATLAKNLAEAASKEATISGNQSCASAYALAAKSAHFYASCAHKARLATSEISKTQDRFSEAISRSTNVFNDTKKIYKLASKNHDAYCRYFALKNDLDTAFRNYIFSARKAIDVYDKTRNLSLEYSTAHSNYVSAAKKAIDIYEENKSVYVDTSKNGPYMITSNSIDNHNHVIAIEDVNDHNRTIIIQESGEDEIITIDDELPTIQNHEVITIDDES